MKGLLIFLSILLFFPLPENAFSDTVDDLSKNLNGYDQDAQISALDNLAKIGNEKAVSSLFHFVYRKGESWRLKIRAIRLLGNIPDPGVTDKLVTIFNDPFLNDECPAMKWHTALALGQGFNKGSRAVDALINALDYNNLLVREGIIQSLGQIGDPTAVPSLVPALTNKSFAIKYSAIKALENIGDMSALPFLRKVADGDADTFLRDEALKAINRISGRIETHQ